MLDGRILSAPLINSRIEDYGVIQGRFTEREVRDLARLLNAGALPVQVKLVEQRVTSDD